MRLIIYIFCSFFIVGKSSYACSCTLLLDIKDDFHNSDYVVVGKIISVEELKRIDTSQLYSLIKSYHTNYPDRIISKKDSISDSLFATQFYKKYKLLVTRGYKGRIMKDTVEILSERGYGGDCGFIFKIGETYIVYGHGWINQSNQFEYWTSICTRTKLKNDWEIAELEKLSK